MADFTVYFKEHPIHNVLQLHYHAPYASGSIPIKDTATLIKEINEVCGAGSYLRYSKTERQPNGTRAYKGEGNLGFVQQGFKTKVIEEAYTAAKGCLKHFNYTSISEWVEEFYDWYD